MNGQTTDSPDSRIIGFIKRHHVMTVATCAGSPWCANLFYAWSDRYGCFVVTSDKTTRHGAEFRSHPAVAASVVLETRTVGRIQGLQIAGCVTNASRSAEPSADEIRRIYLKRFPYAALSELELWILRPHTLKYTDNTLGFGKKILWTMPQQKADR